MSMYPQRAAQIRAHGGMPPGADFDPLEPDTLEGIVRGTSPILLALDGPKGAAR